MVFIMAIVTKKRQIGQKPDPSRHLQIFFDEPFGAVFLHQLFGQQHVFAAGRVQFQKRPQPA